MGQDFDVRSFSLQPDYSAISHDPLLSVKSGHPQLFLTKTGGASAGAANAVVAIIVDKTLAVSVCLTKVFTKISLQIIQQMMLLHLPIHLMFLHLPFFLMIYLHHQ